MSQFKVFSNGESHSNTGFARVAFLQEGGEWFLAPVVKHQRSGYRSGRCTTQGVPRDMREYVTAEVVIHGRFHHVLPTWRLYVWGEEARGGVPETVRTACLAALEKTGNGGFLGTAEGKYRDYRIALNYEGEPLFHRFAREKSEWTLGKERKLPAEVVSKIVASRHEIETIPREEVGSLKLLNYSAQSTVSKVCRRWAFFTPTGLPLSIEVDSYGWEPRSERGRKAPVPPAEAVRAAVRQHGGLTAVEWGAYTTARYHSSYGAMVYIIT